MSIRDSGFARVDSERYETPDFVTGVLCDHFPITGKMVWEPAAGTGKMVRSLKERGARVVFATDIEECGPHIDLALDFQATLLGPDDLPIWGERVDLIVTNPPYGRAGRLAESFIRRGLEYLRTRKAERLALLLRADFDSGSTRDDLFEKAPEFRARIVLRRRIEWFKPQPGQGGSSTNHAWFLWDRGWGNIAGRLPEVRYGP